MSTSPQGCSLSIEAAGEPLCDDRSQPLAPTYAQILRAPGVIRVFAPAAVGRLGHSMVALSVVLSLQQQTGSFAVAGFALGAMGLGNVVASPTRGRLVDLFGQARTLPLMACAYVVVLVSMVALASETPTWLLLCAATITGLLMPPIGPAMRATWATLAPAGPARTRAFALDAVVEDTAFVVGPASVALIASSWGGNWSVYAASGLLLVGTMGMVTSSASQETSRVANGSQLRSTARDEEPGRWFSRGAFAHRQFRAGLVVIVGVGVVLGAAEIAATAFAEVHEGTAAAGLLLSAFAAGSVLGGLYYGSRRWRSAVAVRLFILSAGVVLAAVCVALSPNIAVFALLVAVLGALMGPAIVSAYVFADESSTPATRTESAAWVATAVHGGVSIAALFTGLLIDAIGPGHAIAVAAVVAGLATISPALALLGRGQR